MKIAAISDTHLKKLPIELDSDVHILIHAGDLTFDGSLSQVMEGFKKLERYKARYKIFIPGNHDFLFERSKDLAEDIAKQFGWIVLQDRSIDIEGISIYGTAIQPVFYNWAFNLEDAKRKEFWAINNKTYDIVVSHCPPRGIADLCSNGNVGCEFLLEYINRHSPKYLICGHIHEGYGEWDYKSIKIINASICNNKYKNTNKPIYFNI